METYTLTFGDCTKTHVGMQQIGSKSYKGFSTKDVKNIMKKARDNNFECKMYKLEKLIDQDVEKSRVLVIRNGIELFDIYADDIFIEQKNLNHYKKVHYNLFFDDECQENERIIAYNDVPITSKLRDKLPDVFGQKHHSLKLEGNYYYDIDKCEIGFDEERRKVIGQGYMRKWLCDLLYSSTVVALEKATGNYWKNSGLFTLRHEAKK